MPVPEMSIMNKNVNPEMTMNTTDGKSILNTPGSLLTPGPMETPSLMNAQMSTPKETEETVKIKKKKSKLILDNEIIAGNIFALIKANLTC